MASWFLKNFKLGLFIPVRFTGFQQAGDYARQQKLRGYVPTMNEPTNLISK